MADLFTPLQVNPALIARPAAPKLPTGASQADIAKSAHDFEAMAIAQFLQPMFDTVDTSKGLFGGGAGEEAWRPMMIEQLAKKLADHGGLGLATQIQAAMQRAQGAALGPALASTGGSTRGTAPPNMPGSTPGTPPKSAPGTQPGTLRK